MSYVRVNDSSDSEDDPMADPFSSPPRPLTTRTRHGSAAAASLAGLNARSYSALSTVDQDHSLSTTTNHTTDTTRTTISQRDRMERTHATQIHPLAATEDQGSSDNDLEIHIRFGEGQDLRLRVPRTDTIRTVKEKIKVARPAIDKKYLRLIHSGKILLDDKTLIETLPKSLFTHIEIPKTHSGTESSGHPRISSSVEAAANNILAGLTGTGTGEKQKSALGSILPTHHAPPSSASRGSDETTLSGRPPGSHISITMPPIDPPLPSATTTATTTHRRSTVFIPVQIGPIYFLCSLSDIAPTPAPSAVKKGKAVAIDPAATSASRRSGTSSRASRSRAAQGSSSGTGASAAASSSLSFPGRTRTQSQSQGTPTEGEAAESSSGSTLTPEEGIEEDLPAEMTPQATGFDRLREAGFSEDEIRSIRRQFHASRGTATATVGENGIAVGMDQDEDASAQARRIEEEWIDQHGAETLPDGLEGSYGEMVWGLMLGFFMGLIALFWFKEATFSRRQQMGIIAGLMINLGFGVLHLYY